MADTTRTLIATDSGTHGRPENVSVYRLADGRYQTVRGFGGGVIRDEITATYPDVEALRTPGRIRVLKAGRRQS